MVRVCIVVESSGGSRIVRGGGLPTPKVGVLTYDFTNFFAENCMKMKEFGPRSGGGDVPGPPLGSANGKSHIVKYTCT